MNPHNVPFYLDVSTKALPAVELDNGSLLIEGMALTFDLDREDERFWESNGSLWQGIQRFLSGNAPLAYHHQYDKIIGRMLSAERAPTGIRVKALVDYQPETSPLRFIYEGIRNQRLNHLSLGGVFKREVGPDGLPQIIDADFLELSVTGVPAAKNGATTFQIIAQKALNAPEGKAVSATGEYVMPLSGLRNALDGFIEDPARRRRVKLEELAEREKANNRSDRVETTEHRDVSTAELFGVGQNSRDKYGNRKYRDEVWDGPEQPLPDEISAAERNMLFNIPTHAPMEPTPEMIFAAEARKTEDRKWADGLRETIDALVSAKEK